MKTQKLKFIAILGLSVFMAACSSSGLKPEEAQKLICARYNLPKVMSAPLQNGTIRFVHAGGLSETKKLANAGIVTCEVVKNSDGYDHGVYQVSLTPVGARIKVKDTTDEEGRTFYIFKTADKVFATITEIKQSEDGASANISYSIEYINTTPVFDVFGVREKRKRVKANKEGKYIVKREARFKKTEEGVWEMLQNQKTGKDYMNDMHENFTRRGANSIATDDPNDVEY